MHIRYVIPMLLGAALLAPPADAAQEFYGVIESRPPDKVGQWVVGGRKVKVTADSRLEADHGPFVVGACVEVEHRRNVVIEMSTESKSKCKR